MITRDRGEPLPAERIDLDVPADDAGSRLDRFIASRLGGPDAFTDPAADPRGSGRSSTGRRRRPGTAVRNGDVVRHRDPRARPDDAANPRRSPSTSSTTTRTSWSSTSPPAWSCIRPPVTRTATLVNALLHHVRDLSGIGGELRPGIVHRLDRGTSGAMVVAKHDRAHAELARQFADREVEKEYVALVWGLVRQGRRIDLPTSAATRSTGSASRCGRAGAREAVTRVVAAEALDGVTLVRVAIATGRTHQIRVHLAAVGHPVVGDAVYGGCRRHPPPHLRVVQRLDRPFLHAARLSFAHPRDGRPIVISCAGSRTTCSMSPTRSAP